MISGAQIEHFERAGRRQPRGEFAGVAMELRERSGEVCGSAGGRCDQGESGKRDRGCNETLHANAIADPAATFLPGFGSRFGERAAA